jgi:S-adenosylmethionine:tRNA ribosyltransferase-isomerase
MGSTAVTLSAERCAGGDGQVQRIQFSWDKPEFTFGEILEAVGILPIPPYLHRETEASDKEAYQTVYSKVRGSVAAPTAGLHFTERLLSELRVGGVRTCELTLHVGAGTFKPVSTDVIGGHVMHTELFSVKRSVIAGLLENIGRITAVGTTTVRTLESLYYIGLSSPPDCQVSQWAPYEVVSSGQSEKTVEASLSNIIRFLDSNGLDEIVATTRLLIAPGYRFRLVNNMITNFHQPRSTLLLLVSAFVGGEWRKLYDYALSHNFRFLSYGDSCLLLGSGGISSALY